MKLPTDEQMIQAARYLFGDEGSIEVDDNAQVSRALGNSQGAYVQAWVWVDDETARKQQ